MWSIIRTGLPSLKPTYVPAHLWLLDLVVDNSFIPLSWPKTKLHLALSVSPRSHWTSCQRSDTLAVNVKMTSERYIPEHRRTQFKAKNTFKPDELRRRREEQQVEIRKQKREENLAKRRGISGRDGLTAPGASLGASIDSDDDGGTIESQVCYILSLYSLKAIFVWMQRFSLLPHSVSCCILSLKAAQSIP